MSKKFNRLSLSVKSASYYYYFNFTIFIKFFFFSLFYSEEAAVKKIQTPANRALPERPAQAQSKSSMFYFFCFHLL